MTLSVLDVIIADGYVTPANLADGKVALVGNDYSAIAAQASTSCTFLSNRLDEKGLSYINGKTIKKGKVKSYSNRVYTRPTNLVAKCDYSGITPVANAVYEIILVRKEVENFVPSRRIYQITTGSTAPTLTALLDQFVAAINSDPSNNGIGALQSATGNIIYVTPVAQVSKYNLDDDSSFQTFEIFNTTGFPTTLLYTYTASKAGAGGYSFVATQERFSVGYRNTGNNWMPDQYSNPTYYTQLFSVAMTIATAATVAVTAGSAVITFNATIAGEIAVGDRIMITSGTTDSYVVVNVAVDNVTVTLNKAFTGTTAAALAVANVTRNGGYDLFIIEHYGSDVSITQGQSLDPITTMVALKEGTNGYSGLETLLGSGVVNIAQWV